MCVGVQVTLRPAPGVVHMEPNATVKLLLRVPTAREENTPDALGVSEASREPGGVRCAGLVGCRVLGLGAPGLFGS